MTRPRFLPLLTTLLVAAVAGALPPSGASAQPPGGTNAGPGAIMLIGGALDDDNSAVYGEFVRRAGGAQARIGVLSASSATPHWSANQVGKVLERYGAAEAIWIPVTAKRDGSGDDPSHAALAASMTGFFVAGGDQFRYVQSMIHADGADGAVLAAIRQRFLAGAPVAGTSAGMQIFAGPHMITGGLSYYGVRDGSRPGYFDDDQILGHWPGGGFNFFTSGLVDTHFDARGRTGRSIRLAADTGHDRVYGVGEDTAMIVTGAGTSSETARVVGTNGVSVLDLRSSQVSQADGHWAISGVRWSYLTDGDSYDPGQWQVTKGAGSAPATPTSRQAAPPTTDVFGPYALRDAALDLADAGLATSTTGTTAELTPRFVVNLTKGSAFRAYRVETASPASFTDLTVSVHAG